MVNLYKESNGVECRACGAAFAQPDEYGPFCNVCMKKFRYEYYGTIDSKSKPHTDDDLNKWLVRQLELNILRKTKHGFAARCEGLTGQDQNGNLGYQCGFYASHKVCGRYLCESHAYPKGKGFKHRTKFIEEYKSPYVWLEEMVSDLSKHDPDFRMAVLKGVGIYK